MSNEETFKNKSIRDKVYETFMVIIALYLGSVIFAAIMIIAMRILPSNYELPFSIVTIAVLAVVAVICVTLTLRRAKMLIKYIAEPIAELSVVANRITEGKLDDEIAYRSEDEIGVLAHDFRKTDTILHQIITDLSSILDKFAAGDLTVESTCPESYVGEFAPVMDRLIALVTNMSSVLGSIRAASDEVAAGASQLAESSQDLAKGAEQQASAVEALAESVSDVTSQVVANSKSTDIVHDKAKEVSLEANTSQKKMTELMNAMERISATSQEIEKVIVEIENIASQTNLLSLNASIEAARAGDAGKGFAVVAEQIRVLAENSAESAETSKHLLEANRVEVERGNSVTNETASSLAKVLEELDNIVQEVANIRTASDQQAFSVKEIESGVNEITGVIQNNSSASQEASATSEELSAEADSLDSLVAKFKILNV